MSVIRKFRRSIMVSVASLLAVLGIASTALAFSSGTTFTVSPGARVCLAPQYATSYLNIQGNASKGARFLVLQGTNYYDVSNEIFRTSDWTTATAASFSPYTNPGQFPGYFRLCVRNSNTTPITASLYMTGQ